MIVYIGAYVCFSLAMFVVNTPIAKHIFNKYVLIELLSKLNISREKHSIAYIYTCEIIGDTL